jgi:hypothetical protein
MTSIIAPEFNSMRALDVSILLMLSASHFGFGQVPNTDSSISRFPELPGTGVNSDLARNDSVLRQTTGSPEVIVVRFHTLFDDRSSVSNRIAR